MPDHNLRASLNGVVQWGVESGVLDFGVDVHLHTHQENDCLHVLLQDGKVQEILSFAVHLYIHVGTCVHDIQTLCSYMYVL